MIEDKLPDTECPSGRTVVPELSLETRERGLGINWIVSENPTRAREGFDGGLLSRSLWMSFADISGKENGGTRDSSLFGLHGALPPRIVFGSLGFRMKLKSLTLLIAVDLL